MLEKSWRSRFTRRLASRVSKVGLEAGAKRQRLFPYGIVDATTEKPTITPPQIVPSGVKKKIVRPERQVEPVAGWQFKRR